jgi:hypothetical protein
MPIHDYVCADGHKTEALVLRPEDELKTCPALVPVEWECEDLEVPCRLPVSRVVSAPAGSFPGAGSWRGVR